MRALPLLRDLFRHMEWADALVWSAVLPDATLAGDAALRDRMLHLHLVQRAFLHIWRSEAMDFAGSMKLQGLELARWGRTYHDEAALQIAGFDDTALDRPVHLPWSDEIMKRLGATISDPTLGETITQVAMHSAYHRGQVNARLRELGTEPPLTDFIAWIWSGRPEPAWPHVIH